MWLCVRAGALANQGTRGTFKLPSEQAAMAPGSRTTKVAPAPHPQDSMADPSIDTLASCLDSARQSVMQTSEMSEPSPPKTKPGLDVKGFDVKEQDVHFVPVDVTCTFFTISNVDTTDMAFEASQCTPGPINQNGAKN